MAKRPTTKPQTPNADWRIAILHGKERFLITELTEQLKAAIRAEHGETETFTFDGEQAAAADVLDECRSFGLMQQHRLIIVDNAEKLVREDTRPLLERYAEAPSDQATLVLRAQTWRPGKLDKLATKAGGVIKCEPLKDRDAVAWVKHRVEHAHAATMDPGAAELLVDRIGTALARLDSEIAKLATAAGSDMKSAKDRTPKITKKLVTEFVGQAREEMMWEIQSRLLSSTPEAGIAFLRHEINTNRQPPVFASLTMMDLAMKLHSAASGLAQRERPGEIAARLRLWGESRDAILGIARSAPPTATAEMLARAVNADAGMKSGLGDQMRQLERLAIQFSSLAAR